MVRISSGVIIICMASITGIRRVVIIAVVASSTVICDSGMSAVQLVKIVVDGKGRRQPIRLRGMAAFAIGG